MYVNHHRTAAPQNPAGKLSTGSPFLAPSVIGPSSGRLVALGLMMLGCVVFVGCGGGTEGRKTTYRISGTVHVDGQPANYLAVRAHPVAGVDKGDPTYSSAFTDEEGKFVLSTYESGDGIPEGQYTLTFNWGEMNLLSMSYGGPDKLKKRYDDPVKSEIKITVGPDQPEDIGVIELTTK
ncbi:hypothetical protein SH139x_000503 [Planctomycetaceae bacterium SH139]